MQTKHMLRAMSSNLSLCVWCLLNIITHTHTHPFSHPIPISCLSRPFLLTLALFLSFSFSPPFLIQNYAIHITLLFLFPSSGLTIHTDRYPRPLGPKRRKLSCSASFAVDHTLRIADRHLYTPIDSITHTMVPPLPTPPSTTPSQRLPRYAQSTLSQRLKANHPQHSIDSSSSSTTGRKRNINPVEDSPIKHPQKTRIITSSNITANVRYRSSDIIHDTNACMFKIKLDSQGRIGNVN